MYKWYLPTLSEIISLSEPVQGSRLGFPAQQRVRAEREWSGAIAALNALLQQLTEVDQATDSNSSVIKGLVLSGPFPVLDQPDLVDCFSTWAFTSDPLSAPAWLPFQLLPAGSEQSSVANLAMSTLPLVPTDPLAAEQFCVALTSEFAVVVTLGEGVSGEPAFLFSFAPEVVWQAWRSLRSRLMLTSPQFLQTLDALVERFAPVAPSYQVVTQFSRLMLANLPEPLDWEGERDSQSGLRRPASTSASHLLNGAQPELEPLEIGAAKALWQQTVASTKGNQSSKTKETWEQKHSLDFAQAKTNSDTELLQAIAHEVRTPLTTIRTLTRLLLKRKDLNPDVTKRLKIIDRECTEQIDRFSLIFRAVELETAMVKQPLSPLAPVSLADVFQQNVPRWQEQASQRNLNLNVMLPQKLPMVVADPTMLEQVLTGLIDRITHSLPPGSDIHVRVQLAGHQLKLQFQSQPPLSTSGDGTETQVAHCKPKPALKSIGQLLMFQPETGNLSLNLSVTKNLFQALGGKLIVRERPEQGEVLTVFLPLETRSELGN